MGWRNVYRKKRRLMATVGGKTAAAAAAAATLLLARSVGGLLAQSIAVEVEHFTPAGSKRLSPARGCFDVTLGAWPNEGADRDDFSPHAQMTVVKGGVERDDMSFFQVLTEAWQSTRVRVSIEDCSPLTAVIVSFGAEPVPSRHDFLAHAMLDTDGNGTCGVDIISRPSYIRDGVWHFAVVGGEPLLGNRYFGGPPDRLKFEAVVAAESAVYPTLDRGVTPWGDCVRRVSIPPASVPMIRYKAGGSGSGDGDFLPTIGRFPPVTGTARRTVKDDSYNGKDDEHASQKTKRAASWPHWLGYFTVSASDEVVTIPFEVVVLVDGKSITHVSEEHHVTGGRRGKEAGTGEVGGIEGESESSKRRPGWGRELTSLAERGEGNNESFHRDERLENGGDGDDCEVILCAAAGVIPLGFPQDPGAAPELGRWRSGDGTRLCRSATVEGIGTAVSGVLDLPQNPQAGRWYLTARADCGNSSPRFRLGRRLGLESDDEPSNRKTDGTIEGVDIASVAAAFTNSPVTNSSDTATDVSSEELETKQGGRDKDSGWGGLKVLSLQRDWAHMEWKADALVPDGSENGADPETCPSAVDARDAFELRAAVVAQACPLGAVGVDGVDMNLLDVGDDSSSSGGSSGEASRRFACVGTVLPMTMSRSGVDRDHEGRPRALSNLLLNEGGVSNKQDGVNDGPSRWMWRGPRPPSVWYAVDMSGREIGASMEIKLTVNSSAPARDATRSSLDSPSAWRMGPYSASGEGEFDGDGWGCPPVGNGTLPPHDEAFFNLTVAVRAGAFPDMDVNGTAGEGTWVFHTNEALREAVELEPCPFLFGAENAVSSSSSSRSKAFSRNHNNDNDDGDDRITARWSTTFTWNMTRPPPLPPSAGTAGIAKGDLVTKLFLAVYGDTVDDDARRAEIYGEGEARGEDGGDDAELLWALGVAARVSFSYCTEDTCPADRGQCRTTASGGDGDDYVKISKCYCFYGYGGEACVYRVVSLASLVWKLVCLVCSNLAVIPGVRVALSLGAAIGASPAIVLSLTGIVSALYHMCDLDLTCAAGILSYHSLQALDFFFSFFSIAVLVLHLCPMPWDEPLVIMPTSTTNNNNNNNSNNNNNNNNSYEIATEDGLNEGSQNPRLGRENPLGGRDVRGGGDETAAADREGRHPDDPDDRAPSLVIMHGGSLEEGKEEEEEEDEKYEEKEKGEEKGGTRLAALYVCLIPPLLVSVTDNPTAEANLAIVFAMCGALLAFSWGRLVARDARGWRSEAAAKLDEEWAEQGHRGRSGGTGTGTSISIGGSSAGEATRLNADVDEAAGMLPNRWEPLMEEEQEQEQEQEHDAEGQVQVGGRHGRGEERGNAGIVRYRNSSPVASSRRQTLRGRGREAAFGGDSNDGDSHVVGSLLVPPRGARAVSSAAIYSQGRRFGYWYSGGEMGIKPVCRGVFQSLRRVTVDRGLLDWKQLGFGVAVFALGLACFALQGMPATAKSYHLWHGAWHVLAMGSAVPILRARRWGATETSVGGVTSSGRREMQGEVGSGWSSILMACVRRCVPVEIRTYEMVPGR